MPEALSKDESEVTFEALTPHIGSLAHGIDVSKPVPPAVMTRLRRELADRSVIVLRDQSLTPEQLIAVSRDFGPLEKHVLSNFCLPDHPEIFVVSNIIEDGRHIGAHGGSKQYHSDLSYLPEPSMGSLFYCLECPEDGGETAFASMFAAFDALPEDRKKWLAERDGVHDYVWNYERAHLQNRAPLTEEQKAKTPPVLHPSVRTHPENGRPALFISEVFTRSFEGEDEAESQALIHELMEFAAQPAFVYAHKWRSGDLIIWDNRSAVHKAMPFDEANTRRRMHRTTITGDRPYFNG